MNNRPNNRERLHLAKVKEMPCGVCNASGPSDAHHIVNTYVFLYAKTVTKVHLMAYTDRLGFGK